MNAQSKPLLAADRVRVYLTLVPYLLEHGQVSLADAAPAATGCVYRSRCPIAMPVCAEVVPELVAIAPDRQAACHALTAP